MDAEIALLRQHLPLDLHYNILPTLQVLKMLSMDNEDNLGFHYLHWRLENEGGYEMPDHFGPFTGNVIGNGRITVAYAEGLQEYFFSENANDYIELVGHYHTLKLMEALMEMVTNLPRTLDLMRVHDFAATYMGEFSPFRGLAMHALQEEAEQAMTDVDGESDSDDDSVSDEEV